MALRIEFDIVGILMDNMLEVELACWLFDNNFDLDIHS
jgi:hypothetical protein